MVNFESKFWNVPKISPVPKKSFVLFVFCFWNNDTWNPYLLCNSHRPFCLQNQKTRWSRHCGCDIFKRRYRDLFRRLADEQKVPFLILDVQSSLRTLKDGIAHRAEQRTDTLEATLSVLLQRQREKEPLGEDEQKVTITINSEESLDPRIIFQDLLKSKCWCK